MLDPRDEYRCPKCGSNGITVVTLQTIRFTIVPGGKYGCEFETGEQVETEHIKNLYFECYPCDTIYSDIHELDVTPVRES